MSTASWIDCPSLSARGSDGDPMSRTGWTPILIPAVLALLTAPACGTQVASDRGKERVVLLHGLARSSGSMGSFETYFERNGFAVTNIDYPSRKETVEELSAGLEERLAPLCADPRTRLNFVTHSLGGILLRHYLAHHDCAALGRVVMLSPPNQGTEIVDKIGDTAWFKKVMGPSAVELGTDPNSVPVTLGPVEFELGVIMGDRSINPIGSSMIPGEDDGTVSVASARVDGMKEFLVVPSTHTFILKSREAMEQARHFIEHGAFRRDDDER